MNKSKGASSNGFEPRKKTKYMFNDEQLDEIEKAANAAANAHTPEEVDTIMKTSR